MELVKVTNQHAIFKQGDQIIMKPLDEKAKSILDWNNKNIPANQ